MATIPPSDDSKTMDFLPPHMRVPAAVASYSVCSGTMLLFNKLAMHYGTSCWGNDGMGGREGREGRDRATGMWLIRGQRHAGLAGAALELRATASPRQE